MANRRTGKPGVRDKSPGSGFVYKERSYESVKKQADRKIGRFDSPYKQGFDTFSPKAGDNTIRLLPPTWEDHEHFGYEVYMHSYVGPDESTYICPRKLDGSPCPICEAAQDAKKQGDEEEAKAFSAKPRVLYWVIDRDGDETTPLIYNVSTFMDKEILKQSLDNPRNAVLFVDNPWKGYDLTFQKTGVGLRTKYQGVKFVRQTSPICEDEADTDKVLDFIEENPLPDLLNLFDYDYLEKVISGTSEKPDKETEEDDEPKKERTSPRRPRSAEPEEEERAPSSRRRSAEPEDETHDRVGRKIDKALARARGGDDENEDDERPTRVVKSSREDTSERPSRRSKEPEEEEEDRPVRSRRSTDTTEEDRGSRRRSKEPEEEEEDDPPTSRRSSSRGRSEEDDDEPPFEKSSPAKRTKSNGQGRRDDTEEEDDPPVRRRMREETAEEDEPRARRRARD